MFVFWQLTVSQPSCGLHKDAFSSSFKSILRAGEFDIEQSRVRRSDDSGVVDDLGPEAPSPSSTSSSASSSSNLSAGLSADPIKPTSTAENALEKPSRNVSGDDRRSSDDSGAVNPGVKSSLISTPLNVVDNCAASTAMTLAVTSAARSRNVVVVVKSTTSAAVTDDDTNRSSLVQNVIPATEQAEQLKNRSPRNATLTPAPTSVRGSAPIKVFPASSDIICTSKLVVGGNPKRRQQSVDDEKRVTQNSSLRRMESSPCSLTAAAASLAAKETSPAEVSSSKDGRVTHVVPRSQPAAIKLNVASSTPGTSSSQHAAAVTSKAQTATSVAGPVSRLAVHAPEQSEKVRSSEKTAAATRQRHRSTSVETTNASHPVTSSDTRKPAGVSMYDDNCDKHNSETSKLKTDLTENERASKVTPTTTRCHVPPNAPPSARQSLALTPSTDVSKNVVIGRVKRISSRDEHATPVTSSCLASEKPSRKPTSRGIGSRVPQSTPHVDEHTGPVISDVFESLRLRQEQAAAAVEARIPATGALGSGKPRQRPTRSARPKTGRSSVISVTSRTKHPSSRQPSAAVTRYKKPKTPTSVVSSAAVTSAKTPRGRKDRKPSGRGRRRRSKSSSRKEEFEREPELVSGASDVTLIGGIGWQIATKCDDVSGVHAVAKVRYAPSKSDKTEEVNASQPSKCAGRSRTSCERSTSLDIPSVVPEHFRDSAGSRKDDVVTSEVGAANAEVAAVGKHKRSTSSSDATPPDKGLKDERGSCKYVVPGPTVRLSREDDNLPRRMSSRRKSLSADQICCGDDTVVPDVIAPGIQPFAAAAAVERQSGCSEHLLVRQSGILPTSSSELGRKEDAEPTAATDEMRSQPSRRSSRRSRPAESSTDAVVEHGDGDQNGHSGVTNVVAAPCNALLRPDDEVTRKTQSQIASTTSGDGNEATEDPTSGDIDRVSPRFVRKRDSVAMSSTGASCVDSRRPSVEKAQGGPGTSTLDGDATLSWHNSLFDNSTAANDLVRNIK